MQLDHEFTVPVPAAQAWTVLLDIARIAPCLPGAVIDDVTEDGFSGRVKVKVGPIAISYAGKGTFVEKDQASGRVLIDAAGKETRGSGTAKASIAAQLHDEGASTRVTVQTDLAITGKPAQFGRGVMGDVGNKLLGQFAECLAGKLAEAPEPAALVEPPVVEPPVVESSVVEPSGAKAAAAGSPVAAPESSPLGPPKSTPRRSPKPAPKTAPKTATKPSPRRTPKPSPAAAPEDAFDLPLETPIDLMPPASGVAVTPAGESPGQPADLPPAAVPPADLPPAAVPPADLPPAAVPPAGAPADRQSPVEPVAIDLIGVAGGAVLKRLAPLAGLAAVLGLLISVVRRSRR